MNEMGEVCDFLCSSKNHVMQTATPQAPLEPYNSTRYSISSVEREDELHLCPEPLGLVF